jgi:hypothetical protein
MIAFSMNLLSQNDSRLILPEEAGESLRICLSELSHLDPELPAYEHLSIFVENKAGDYGSNAVQGRYSIKNEYLVFTPYFPFELGMKYVARTINPGKNDDFAYHTFQVGKKQTYAKAKVLSIHPLADEIPENSLRFYIYFNTPMKKGHALKHIQLADPQGNVDKHAFMEFKQELWSPDGKRLTVLFDPGRIKRGVSTNFELGPSLLEGNKYTLTISGTWQDVYGQELSVKATKEFIVGSAYRTTLKVGELYIQKPEANSTEKLSIHFDRIIDHALVQSMIRIEDEKNKAIAGSWETSGDETVVHFIPAKPWKKGKYKIIMDGSFEDVAGNNLHNLLDKKGACKIFCVNG